MPILGEGHRWRNKYEHGVLFNMRNGDVASSMDTACGVMVLPVPDSLGSAYHITNLAPYVSTYHHPRAGDLSIVHHMDLFACDERMVAAPDDRHCMDDAWLGDSGPCYALMWAYDKGGLAPHALPRDAGFRIGAGTRFRTLLLQIHYLLPDIGGGADEHHGVSDAHGGPVELLTAAELQRAGYHDTSGVHVELSRVLRPLDAWSFEFMSYNMRIPPGTTGLEYANQLLEHDVLRILGDDLRSAPNGTLTLRQIHAHAHSHATKVMLLRTRSGRTETIFHLEPYCGYGSCQHFHDFATAAATSTVPLASPTIRAGDALEFRCVYDNDDQYELGYGLSAMNEMCGPILIYTPHDHRVRPRVTWNDSPNGLMRLHELAQAVGGEVKAAQMGVDGWARSRQHQTDDSDFP